MMQSSTIITRENVLDVIKKFAKEYRKEYGKTPAEIIIVGGGSIMINYKFRESTQDLDVILRAASGVKDLIKRFADDNGLPRDWMNTDFMATNSYSPRLVEISKHYYSLNNNTVEVRTVSGEYLIAMKLRAARAYRNDISDIYGILIEEREKGHFIDFEMIDNAYKKLYMESIPEELSLLMKTTCDLDIKELKEVFDSRRNNEDYIGNTIISYIEKGVEINTKNVDTVIEAIKKKINS